MNSMYGKHNASHLPCALRNIISWLRTFELLISNYTYILFQSLSLTGQDAINVFWGETISQASRETLHTFGRRSTVERLTRVQ